MHRICYGYENNSVCICLGIGGVILSGEAEYIEEGYPGEKGELSTAHQVIIGCRGLNNVS